MKDIYYRGALLILKKNKYFKKKTLKSGRWSYKGYLEESLMNDIMRLALNSSTNSENEAESRQGFGMQYLDEIEDNWSYIMYDDLLDIRVNPSYFVFQTLRIIII